MIAHKKINNSKRTTTNKNSKKSLSQTIYDNILNKLLKNEIVPGDILKRKEIANEYNVSVAPVLEAILKLEIEGFVESIPRKGTIVKPIHKRNLFEQLMLREAIECQAASLYYGEPVLQNRSKLYPLAKKLESTDISMPEHWKLEIEFHQNLILLANCNVLVREFNKVAKLGMFYNINRVYNGTVQAERKSHVELIDLLIKSDSDFAVRIIREHLRSGKKDLFY